MNFYNPFFSSFPPKLPNYIENKKNISEKSDNKSLNLFQNIFDQQDTLILLAILLFLYNQNEYKSPISIFLLLLLFDDSGNLI